MTLLRSPDGSWTGDVERPVDVVNLKTRGYTVVESDEPVEVVPAVDVPDLAALAAVGVTLVELSDTAAVSDKPAGKGKDKSGA